MERFTLCHGCACEVVNGDDSGRDFHDLDDNERASRDASIEAMGHAVLVETKDIGCFTCFVCDDIDYGNAEIFEN